MTETPIKASSNLSDRDRPEGLPPGRFYSPGIKLISKARLSRNYQAGQTSDVDAKWTDSELTQAAMYLACPPQFTLVLKSGDSKEVPYLADKNTFPPVPYLRDKESHISNLIESAALICSEIDRLLGLAEEDFLN